MFEHLSRYFNDNPTTPGFYRKHRQHQTLSVCKIVIFNASDVVL